MRCVTAEPVFLLLREEAASPLAPFGYSLQQRESLTLASSPNRYPTNGLASGITNTQWRDSRSVSTKVAFIQGSCHSEVSSSLWLSGYFTETRLSPLLGAARAVSVLSFDFARLYSNISGSPDGITSSTMFQTHGCPHACQRAVPTRTRTICLKNRFPRKWILITGVPSGKDAPVMLQLSRVQTSLPSGFSVSFTRRANAL
mmetsp:Transcript_26405/g.63704  ORF Transcript_26405/g.63704 Transcript_26405/m.63704 type:complete len:201 (+) Transcript_26405:182-784(+)